MEIKRIQLRGISRSPSDRMTEDGGVAESLNVHLDNSEIAPSFLPEDITDSLMLPKNVAAEKVFLHKTTNYENLVWIERGRVYWYSTTSKKKGYISLESGDVVNDIKNIGNVVIVSTTNKLYYLLFKDNSYKLLGNQVPLPQIRFIAEYEGENVVVAQSDQYATALGENPKYFTEIPEESKWNNVDEEKHVEPVLGDKITTFLDRIWSDVSIFYEQYTNPVFVRYTATLYDRTKISSIPILIGAGDENPIIVSLEGNDELTDVAGSSSRSGTFSWTINYNRQKYKIKAIAEDYSELRDWMDIIQSVDIFISRDVPWNLKPKVSQIKDRVYNVGSQTGVNQTVTHTESTATLTFVKDTTAFEQNLLETSSMCYLLESIPLRGTSEKEEEYSFSQGFLELAAGKMLKEREKDNSLFVQKELLSRDDMKHYTMSAKSLDSYNNRLILQQPSQVLSYGYKDLNAHVKYEVAPVDAITNTETIEYKVVFRLNINGQAKYVDGPTVTTTNSDINREAYNAFQVFPDSRCTQIIIKVIRKVNGASQVRYGQYAMLAHPFLDCAYLYKGIDKDLYSLCESENAIQVTIDSLEESNNKLYLSNPDDPFTFPNEGRFTFQSSVLGVAIATTTLSQGQFGQFPLYVFTEDGVWAMETDAYGAFTTCKPLSREVCINPKSITSLDNAVVFVTAKGVMLLQGSQVVNISPFMNGRHYVIESTPKSIVEKQDFFCDLLPALSDHTHFLAFVKEASIAYDYAGNRLIFIKKDEKYQYIYKIDTQTWHKTAYGLDLVTPINSYPECLVQGKKDGKTRIYDLSTIFDAAESKTPTRGVIITRPFDLGESDVFKTIKDVRIRGQFPKGAVKFILLGSNDGIHFSVINTLRGKSWKLFRLIILADLDATDRISWVDIGYETRFTNKLR